MDKFILDLCGIKIKKNYFHFNFIYFLLRELTSKEVAFYNHYNNLNDKILTKKSTIEVYFFS